MKLESGDYCPLVGGPCKKFDCKWWIQLRGTHPQTGQPVDEWDCTVSMLPMLLIEASQQARQAGRHAGRKVGRQLGNHCGRRTLNLWGRRSKTQSDSAAFGWCIEFLFAT